MKARSADAIRQEMASLRSEMRGEMSALAEDAREMSDWHFYVRRYPWVCVGAAALVGYLLVPQRTELVQPNADDLLRLAKKDQVVIKPKPEPQPRGPGSALLRFVTNAAVRAALAYGGQKVGQLMHSGQE